jgi:cytochrome c oxidase accessory protein FixG
MAVASSGSTPSPGNGAGQGGQVLQPMYQKRKEIYPRNRFGPGLGWFQKWRWVFVWITQIVFYGLPWLTWNGRQAFLFDLLARKFYLFGLVLWPQDVVYLTAILIISAYSLFLFTAVGGRLWCGYACPQTVYTEIFIWIEMMVEGDRAKRMARDRQPMSANKAWLKLVKHALWVAFALWTGFTFVGYFMPIRDLAHEILTAQAGGWSLFWVLFYGFATYGNAGWMREQVCKYMCPYARFQSAMFDKDTLIITYDAKRGEPRGFLSKSGGNTAAVRAAKGQGDCVNCGLCVQVCPTGIDIRDGLQYECIGCAVCIDACNHVMKRAGLPGNLIRYTTANAMASRLTRSQTWGRVFRPRILVYFSILVVVVAALITALSLRQPLKVDVLRDRGALSREVEDDLIENVYRLQVMNTGETAEFLSIDVSGLKGLSIASDIKDFEVPPSATKSVILRLRAPSHEVGHGSHNITIEVRSRTSSDVTVREHTTFLGERD